MFSSENDNELLGKAASVCQKIILFNFEITFRVKSWKQQISEKSYKKRQFCFAVDAFRGKHKKQLDACTYFLNFTGKKILVLIESAALSFVYL